MSGFLARLRQALAHPVLAVCGLFGVLGAAPATAAPPPERAALEGRVAELRRHLNSPAAREAGDRRDGSGRSDAQTLVAQAAKWNNWPNWSNWANWRNG